MNEEKTKILEMLASGKIKVSEATELLNAVEGNNKKETNVSRGGMPQYLCVKVEGTGNAKVDIRVPIQLIKTGIKLSTLIPKNVSLQINDKLISKGIDINNLDSEHIDELIVALKDLTVNVEDKGDKVRIYCE